MVLVVSSAKIVRLLARVIAVLSVMGIAAEVARATIQAKSHHAVEVLAGKFVLDGELTVPAWYSSVLLLLCAAALGMIAWIKRERRCTFAKHWAGLAWIFVLLSIDEFAALHEMLITPMQRYFGARGLFHYGWVIPAGLFLGVFAVMYWRFVFQHLDGRTRGRFIFAAVIYVGAALGLEMLEGPVDERFGEHALPAVTLQIVEETLEMVGAVLFLRSLLLYLATYVAEFRVSFERPVARHAQTRSIGTTLCPPAAPRDGDLWDDEPEETDADVWATMDWLRTDFDDIAVQEVEVDQRQVR